jgi:hypothetical protein
MLQIEIKNKWVVSLTINLLLFVAVNIFLLPLFNSGDDVFLLYTLSGGFGDAPTNLLHYDHIWHPGLGWVVKSLYEKLPGINWYGFILMLLQLKACTVFLYLLFKKFRANNALLVYLLFFCFIETRILLSFNFTSTAWITAAAGFLLLLEGTSKQRNIFYIISGFALIMIAGLLRIHVLIAVGILLTPALFIYARKEFKTWSAFIALAAGLLFLLNIQHKNYYKKNIPGWEKQEEYRQVLFKLGNKSENAVTLSKIGYTDSTKLAFYKARFFIDTGFISIAKLEQLGKALKNETHFSLKDSLGGLYWLFVELRVYLLLLAVCIFLLWQAGGLKTFFRHWLIPFLISAGAYFFLSVFMKMTFSLHMGIMLVLWIYSCETLFVCRSAFQVSKIKPIYFILLLLPAAWMGIRIYKTDTDNRIKHEKFKCMVSELKENSDKLFIATDDLLPMPFYSVWDVASENKITNLVYKDRITTFGYQSTAQRFGIKDIMLALITNSKVQLIGKEIPELKKYYRAKYGVEIGLIKTDVRSYCINISHGFCISGCEKYAKEFK